MKKVIIVLIIAILVVVVVSIIFVQNFYGWKTYYNKEFAFELKYPNGWDIQEDFYAGEVDQPKIKEIYIHKQGETGSFFIIYPDGFSTSLSDCVNVKTQEIENYFAGRKVTIHRFLTEKGDVWEEVISDISNLPSGWDRYAYIMIMPKAYGLTWRCADESISDQDCGYGMGRKYFGDIDKSEKEILYKILSTFKFK
jgi:hypothetical protein